MKTIDISTDVFAKLWSLWQPGDETEDDILRRALENQKLEPKPKMQSGSVERSIIEEINPQEQKSPRRPLEINRFETANFRLDGTKYDIEAFAIYGDGNWTVLSGSKVMSNWIGGEANSSYEHLHASLKRNGIIEATSGEYATFTKDYTFTSPSAASAVVVGRSDNGRNSWKHTKTGQTFNEWISEN